MAYSATVSSSSSFLNVLSSPFVALGDFFVALCENNSRVKRVEQLNALSDAELAKLGIKREDIVSHVYADLMGF